MTTTTTTIDCDTCPARGRLCGDCFVPVLGRLWLEAPTTREEGHGVPGHEEEPVQGVPLDSDELAAVSAFVRAGLVHPQEAARAMAVPDTGRRSAVG